ncbi:MAG: dihydrofolate reductase [Proteobacteria bacterium]|nr:MAG: dihydrofolate reductase [Pseudomonadota bacterium]
MLSMIVAMSDNRVIGIENRLPWNIPEDLKRFKKITSGHPIVMGRKTFESIGRPLPNRTNIVVTRNKDYRAEGVAVCGSLGEALEWAARAAGSEEIFVIGGGELFKEALPKADRIYLTEVKWPYEGDAFFPEFDEEAYAVKATETLSQDPPAVLRVLDRKSGAKTREWR